MELLWGQRERQTSPLFVWLISHQPALLFPQNKSTIINQPAVLFPQNKSTIINQPAVLFLSEQTSTRHQPPAKRTGCLKCS
jgi:hypothetical protein